MLYFLCSRMSR